MNRPFKLMCVLAHPDDETLGAGGTLARYAAEGVETYLVTATRGERGWFGPAEEYPGLEALGKLRETELRQAAEILGLREVVFLDYIDGDLDQADPQEATAQIAMHLRRVKPDVVVTFDPFGVYGHPDHVAICQFTAAAVSQAADPTAPHLDGHAPHCVSKLYYMVTTHDEIRRYQDVFGDLVMNIDGAERRPVAWPDWAITTRLDTSPYVEQVWQAVFCHRTQLPGYEALLQLPDEQHRTFWSTMGYYRALSGVNGGRALETDLFTGLREIT